MQILGYGEDGLTLAFLCDSFPQFLIWLGDKTDPNECIVYYRASFGRGGGFGEVDAIVVAPTKIYLCESKWNDRDSLRSSYGSAQGGSGATEYCLSGGPEDSAAREAFELG